MMTDFIHTIQMLDTSLCDDLVDYYNKSGEYKQKGVVSGGLKPDSKTSTDVTIFPTVSYTHLTLPTKRIV